MTDDNVRPEANPSRESRPEGPEEGVADEATTELKGTVDSVEAAAETDASDEATDELEDEAAHSDNAGASDDVAVAGGDEQVDTSSDPEPDAVGEAGVESEADVESAADSAEKDETAPSDTDDAEETEAEPSDTEEASGDEADVGAKAGESFTWHPEHKGKTFDEVRASLAQDIAADQRQHRLAIDGAEESEQEALASVVGLERKWGKFDFDWAEQEPEALADRIFDFERERERRQQMISWSEYRDADIELDEAQAVGERPAELSTSAKGLSLLLVVLLIVLILLAVWAL